MRKAFLWAFWLTGILLCATMVGFGTVKSLIVRFQNPELTETQLFIRCWWMYVMTIVGCFWGSAFLAEKPWSIR